MTAVLVVGDANADLSAQLPRFPREGDDSPISALTWQSGGSAANVATALARLGGRARLVARVGVDPAAEVALSAARAAGVDLSLVQRDPELATGLCFAAVSPGGERTFFSSRGANVALQAVDRRAALHDVGWLHLGGHALIEGPQLATVILLLAEALDRGVKLSLDLCLPVLRVGFVVLEHVRAAVRHAEVVFANKLEVAAADAAGVVLTEAQVLVEKLGARGARVRTRATGAGVGVPAFAVSARDTTGCGDAFVAAYLLGMQRGLVPEAAAVLGNAAGAITATRPGAAEAAPSREELDAFLAARGAARVWSRSNLN